LQYRYKYYPGFDGGFAEALMTHLINCGLFNLSASLLSASCWLQ